MDKDYSHMAGKHIVIDGVNYFSNEYFGDGLSNGYVYKNEQAFCENLMKYVTYQKPLLLMLRQ